MLFELFNQIHVAYLVFSFLFGVTIFFFLRKKTKKIKTVTLLVLIASCAIIKVYNMFQYIEYGWETIFWNLPLYVCSLNVFILPWLVISKKRHPIMAHYLSFIAIPGATFSMIFPGIAESTYPFYSTILLEAFYTHAVYIIIGLLYLLFNDYTISRRYIPQVAILITAISLFGHLVNEILIFTNIDLEANYMFTEYGLRGTPLVILNRIIPIKLLYLLAGYYMMLFSRYCILLIKGLFFSRVKSEVFLNELTD